MSIACAIEGDNAAWYWSTNEKLRTYSVSRGKSCCSCKKMVRLGQVYLPIERFRDPHHDIEERIYGVEVPLAEWAICAECAPAFIKLHDMDVQIDLGRDNVQKLLLEFEESYRPARDFRLKLPVLSMNSSTMRA